MPVDQRALLADCQRQLKLLEADLKAQAAALPDLDARLRAEYAEARAAGRVGDAFEIWRGEQVTQAAVHWVLGGVFVRFLEDNALIDPLIAGPDWRGRDAEHAEQAFYAAGPTWHERDWLLAAFRAVAALPGGAALFDEAHHPAFRWPLSPDAAKALVQFWRRPDPATGALAHAFADPAWDTRFLGDLYQELSEAARKKYALLQTPAFVESFILDRTLGEALRALPLERVTVIDPTCGSGHFLLGAFARLRSAWEAREPGVLREELAQRALDAVAGVDVNSFAVEIARFRLLLDALRACGVERLEHAPKFRLHVTVGDTLLFGADPERLSLGDAGLKRYTQHSFSDEDVVATTSLLSKRYAVVVGNPPYITPKDKKLNEVYRARYRSCHRQYALSIPFVERFWELAATDAGGGVAGWVGQITANSFMKREFGKKLIEEFFPQWDLTHVIDTAGAYIPDHGTDTVILFGRHRRPATDIVRAVMGIAREPGTPADPANGLVWTAIVRQLDDPASESAYVSVADIPREKFEVHPWSLGGGATSDVKTVVDRAGAATLHEVAPEIGFMQMTHADDAFVQPASFFRRLGISEAVRPLVRGESAREWVVTTDEAILFPFDDSLREWAGIPAESRWAWFHALRTALWSRATFGGGTYRDAGLPWFAYHQFPRDRARVRATISFGEVATHNHFVLDRGHAVFTQTAPVIKLPAGADEATHLGLLGLVNSSIACFWLKQVCQVKGGSGIGRGIQSEPWEQRYQFNGTNVADYPVTAERPTDLAAQLDTAARARQQHLPNVLAERTTPTRAALDAARVHADRCVAQMIALQEDLDWRCYRLYGLTDDELTLRDAAGTPAEPPPLALGERAFEIVLARRMAADQEKTTWFDRHGSTPITELPAHWPADYRALVERRIARIERDRNVALVERPEYKRRWNLEAWETLERDALAAWLLDRLETPAYWPDVALQTTRDLATRAALDPEFAGVAALWAGATGVALEPVIRRLVLDEAVPFLPALRYADAGREKRRVWEQVWALQREEDQVDAAVAAEPAFAAPREGESADGLARRLAAAQKARRAAEVGPIPRPPKYASADFQQAAYWRMRGALDVPKERFLLYPHCGREGDDAPLLGWAGWTQLEQAQAIAGWYADRTGQDGWQGERLVPLLAGMQELVPWLRQWHNALDPVHGDRPGETYAAWLDAELQAQGLTRAALDAWAPPRAARRGGRRRATAAGA